MSDYRRTLDFEKNPEKSLTDLVKHFDKLYELSEERLGYTAKIKNLI